MSSTVHIKVSTVAAAVLGTELNRAVRNVRESTERIAATLVSITADLDRGRTTNADSIYLAKYVADLSAAQSKVTALAEVARHGLLTDEQLLIVMTNPTFFSTDATL